MTIKAISTPIYHLHWTITYISCACRTKNQERDDADQSLICEFKGYDFESGTGNLCRIQPYPTLTNTKLELKGGMRILRSQFANQDWE